MTSVPEIARRLIDGVWQTGVAEDSGGGSQPGAVVGRKFSFTFEDFTVDMTNGAFASVPFYTLQPDEQLLFMTARVTELFDDSGPFAGSLFLDDDNSATFAGIAMSQADVPTPVQGMVSLFGDDINGKAWNGMQNAVEPDTVAKGIRMGSLNWAGDGNQGAVDVTIYTCTPIAS